MLPVSGPVSSQSEYQDATFSPIKDESQLDGNGGVLASTPNASAADFSGMLPCPTHLRLLLNSAGAVA